MIHSLLNISFAITGLIWFYICIRVGIMLLNAEKYFIATGSAKRLSLKAIKQFIENAPSTEAKEKLVGFKKEYIVFLCFFWLSILLFVINIIEINWK